jgi:predicted PurR-regulated permease PerM
MPLTPPTAQQSRFLWFALTALAVAVVTALIVVAVWGLAKIVDLLSPVLWPLAIAGVVACLLSPVVDFFERRKVPRSHAIVLVFVIAFTAVTVVLANVIPQVINETTQLANKVPEYSQRLQARYNQFLAQPPELLRHFLPRPPADAKGPANATDNSSLGLATTWLTGRLPGLGTWLLGRAAKVASSLGLLIGMALVPVYAFHFLLEKRRLESHWREYVPLRESSAKHELIFMLEAIGQYLVSFFRGQVLVAVCVSVLYTIGFLSLGLNYSFLLGSVAVFLTMVPFLGAIIVCVTALLLAFVQYTDWQHPALVLAVFTLVQSIEAFFISPKIMGNRVGLHPLFIIIAVMAGTTLLGGLLGGLLAIPLAAALRVMLARYVWARL